MSQSLAKATIGLQVEAQRNLYNETFLLRQRRQNGKRAKEEALSWVIGKSTLLDAVHWPICQEDGLRVKLAGYVSGQKWRRVPFCWGSQVIRLE